LRHEREIARRDRAERLHDRDVAAGDEGFRAAAGEDEDLDRRIVCQRGKELFEFAASSALST
jgi:hypothetical protein